MRREIELVEAEAAVHELHTEAGAELTAAWHLPIEVIEACRWHHEPQDRAYPHLAASAAALAVVEETGGRRDEARQALTAMGLGNSDIEPLVAIALEERSSRGSPGTVQ
jgi:HD-like signal output (HDOD) protein